MWRDFAVSIFALFYLFSFYMIFFVDYFLIKYFLSYDAGLISQELLSCCLLSSSVSTDIRLLPELNYRTQMCQSHCVFPAQMNSLQQWQEAYYENVVESFQ